MANTVSASEQLPVYGAGNCGPFKSSGGDFYTVLIDDTAQAVAGAFKASDPLVDTWVEQDGAGRPTPGGVISGMDCQQVGDVIHVVSQQNGSAVTYHEFNMATDNWDVADEAVGNTTDAQIDFFDCGIAVRSDGTVVVVYGGENDNNMGNKDRVDFARRTSGGSWSLVDQAVDNGGAINWVPGLAIWSGDSATDRVHFFFSDDSNDDVFQRRLDSSDNLQTFPSAFDTSVHTTTTNRFMFGAGFSESSTFRIMVGYIDSDISLQEAYFDDGATPTVLFDQVTNVVNGNNTRRNAALRPDSAGVKHAIVQDTTTSDFFHTEKDSIGGDWASPTNIEAHTNPAAVSMNIYDNGGEVMAFVFAVSGGGVDYEEFSLVAPTVFLRDPIQAVGVIPFLR